MKHSLPLIIVFLTLGTLFPAFGELTTKAAIDELEAAMTNEAEEAESGSGYDGRREAIIYQMSAAMDEPNAMMNFSGISSQVSSHFKSQAVKTALANLRESVRAEEEKKLRTTLGELQALVDTARESVNSSKTPADLDATIEKLQSSRNRERVEGMRSQEIQMVNQQVEQSLQFLIQWQNYLAAQASGNVRQAQESLRSLSNSNTISLIPRSEILKLLAALERPDSSGNTANKLSITDAADAILAKTDTLEKLSGSIKELRAIQSDQNQYSRNDSLLPLIQALASIDRTYQDHKAGLTTSIETYQQFQLDLGADVASKLRRDLLLVVLPRYVGARDGTTAKTNESVQDFLTRIMAEAKQRGDVAVGMRARETLRLLNRGQSISNADYVGVGSLISGQNQEAAGQFMLAVISYQNALKSGSDLVPAELIGERLRAIESANPAEYEAGMTRFLAPPPVVPYPQDRPMGGRPRPDAMPTPAPALLIPPAPVSSPSPSATK
ncbi:MAG: hypothetical protein ACOVMP_08730 [Chthoniobacterales bacterium]